MSKINKIIVKISLMILCIGIANISIVGASSGDSINISVSKPLSTNISLPFASYNTCNVEFPTSPCQIKYGKTFIIDSVSNVYYDSGWTPELTTSPYTATVTFTPTSVGTYYLISVILNQTYTYSTNWTMTEDIESKEAYQLNVRINTPTITPPTTNIVVLISSLLSWLKELFPSVVW